MKVRDAVKGLNVTWSNLPNGNIEIKSAYAGDFLSYAISSQGEAAIWFTVMNNVNVAGVATLTDCALIVICDDTMPDDGLEMRTKAQGINICSVKTSVYETCVMYSNLIK